MLQALAAVVPAASLLADHEDLKPYECDGLSAYRRVPLAVVLPEDEPLMNETAPTIRPVKSS